ncbi:uncharacterized protein PpBr36_05812 [Pyricularia pennisetigena]|uniref:uncharacterized protein n=1 Tax=Pyricularia pennisetigena TaxID=1578925 RepID=UPI00114D9B9A|nr:uncharacterized protein PpBr36_05812 [Pyricularia pennisetigena]TLS23485.1 hypothetical protein PpBr36_05812 [Pyricularia pennisetigena]
MQPTTSFSFSTTPTLARTLWAAMATKTLRSWRRLRANTTRTECFNEMCLEDSGCQLLEQLRV